MKRKNEADTNADVRYPVHRLNDLLAYRADPNDFILGNGFIRRGGGTMLIGPTNMGKSVLAEQLSLSVASGRDFLGMVKTPKARKVLHIQAENDQAELSNHFRGVVGHLAFSKEEQARAHENLFLYHVFGVTDREFGKVLFDLAIEHEPDLIVIDPYQSFVSGDLNSSSTFLDWIGPVDEVLKRGRAALLMVAHDIKNRNTEGWDPRLMVYRAAGTSALSNWARSSMEIDPLPRDLLRFRLTFSKNAQWTGLVGEDGFVTRQLVLEHNPDPNEPVWKVSEDQVADVRPSFAVAVQTMAFANPTASYKELAKMLGCSVSVVKKHYPRKLKEK